MNYKKYDWRLNIFVMFFYFLVLFNFYCYIKEYLQKGLNDDGVII